MTVYSLLAQTQENFLIVNFLKKNEITIPRLPPKATEPTYKLIECENNFLKVVLIP